MSAFFFPAGYENRHMDPDPVIIYVSATTVERRSAKRVHTVSRLALVAFLLRTADQGVAELVCICRG